MKKTSLKSNLREKYKLIRNKEVQIVEEKIILEVKKALIKLLKDKNHNSHIGIFWPLKGEVDLRNLNLEPTPSLALPATQKGGGLKYHSWGKPSLGKDFTGIPAPISQPVLRPKDIDIIFVPALSVDKRGYRLGYGGGFFDRLRAHQDWRAVPAFVVLPSKCISQEPIPTDPWDVPFNGWITEEGLVEIS